MFNKRSMAGCLLASAALLAPNLTLGQDETPLSAIDWLTQTPTVTIDINPEPPVAEGGNTPDVDVSELGASGREAVGLLPSRVTGLPNALWEESSAHVLANLIADMPDEGLPAIQALLYTLLLAEANPPANADGTDALLLARVDKLVVLGAIEQANALLARATPDRADLFERSRQCA